MGFDTIEINLVSPKNNFCLVFVEHNLLQTTIKIITRVGNCCASEYIILVSYKIGFTSHIEKFFRYFVFWTEKISSFLRQTCII